MKIILGAFVCALCACAVTGAVYIDQLDRFLHDVPVTKYKLPGFVDREYSSEEQTECNQRRGSYSNGVYLGSEPEYDVLQLLKSLGGAPGEVDIPKRNEISNSSLEDPDARPLEDPPENDWSYDYRATDYKFYFRLEHGVKRFPRTEKEFWDIRGRVAWTPENNCGSLKVANYIVDDTGFNATVSHDYCFFGDKRFSCATIPYCQDHANGGRVCVG